MTWLQSCTRCGAGTNTAYNGTFRCDACFAVHATRDTIVQMLRRMDDTKAINLLTLLWSDADRKLQHKENTDAKA